jgi:hypothetical protein
MTMSVLQSGDKYELRINGFPFNHLIELKRNKELFYNNQPISHYNKKNVSNNNITNYSTISSHSNDTKQSSETKPLFDFSIKPVEKEKGKANLQFSGKVVQHNNIREFTISETPKSNKSKSDISLINFSENRRVSFPSINELMDSRGSVSKNDLSVSNASISNANAGVLNNKFKFYEEIEKKRNSKKDLLNSLNDIFGGPVATEEKPLQNNNNVNSKVNANIGNDAIVNNDNNNKNVDNKIADKKKIEEDLNNLFDNLPPVNTKEDLDVDILTNNINYPKLEKLQLNDISQRQRFAADLFN